MTPEISWTTAATAVMPDVDTELLARWIKDVCDSHGCTARKLRYIFCDDEEILRVNREFLGHDYYTDIITFDYSRLPVIAGEMYISLDTVASNAEMLGVAPGRELLRVIIHGVLHLTGIDDKGPGEREFMEANEDAALQLYYSLIN